MKMVKRFLKLYWSNYVKMYEPMAKYGVPAQL